MHKTLTESVNHAINYVVPCAYHGNKLEGSREDKTVAAKEIKPFVLAIIIKETADGLRIMTQTRVVVTPGYDPHNHLTQEGVGETLKPGKGLLNTVYEGIKEE